MSGYLWRGRADLLRLNDEIMACRGPWRPPVDRERSRMSMRPLAEPSRPHRLTDDDLRELERAGLIRWLS